MQLRGCVMPREKVSAVIIFFTIFWYFMKPSGHLAMKESLKGLSAPSLIHSTSIFKTWLPYPSPAWKTKKGNRVYTMLVPKHPDVCVPYVPGLEPLPILTSWIWNLGGSRPCCCCCNLVPRDWTTTSRVRSGLPSGKSNILYPLLLCSFCECVIVDVETSRASDWTFA